MKAISIQQPFADLILNGFKDVENRVWDIPKKYIGQEILLCSSAKPYKEWEKSISEDQRILAEITDFNARLGMALGVIIFTGEKNPNSEWAWAGGGNYAHCIKVVRVFEKPFPVKGKLRLFDVEFEN